MDYSLIKSLCCCCSPSGFETNVRNLILDNIKEKCDEIRIDNMGNLIAKIKGGEGVPITFIAHMDEVGFYISGFDNGCLDVINLNRIDMAKHLGESIVFDESHYCKIIEKDNKYQLIPENENDYYKGMPGTFAPNFSIDRGYLIGKSLDDRIGCYALIELIKNVNNLAQDTCFVFSVKEELNAVGSIYYSRTNNCVGYLFSVDVSPCKIQMTNQGMIFGEGVGIKMCDGGLFVEQSLIELLIKQAKLSGTKWQIDVLNRGGTDVKEIFYAKEDCWCGGISIPCLGGHTGKESVLLTDVEEMIFFLKSIITKGLVALHK